MIAIKTGMSYLLQRSYHRAHIVYLDIVRFVWEHHRNAVDIHVCCAGIHVGR